jgi:beta-glucosidase
MFGVDDDLKDRVARVHLQARLQLDGPVQVGTIGVGLWEFRVASEVRRYRLDPAGGGMFVEILAPPAHVFAVELERGSVVEADVDVVTPFGLFGLIARAAPRNQDDVIADAARAAAAADVAIVVVGLTEEQETESVDKSTLHLPGAQDALVTAVAVAAKKTVVVVNAATPVIMPWLEDVDAVLWAGLPGQEGGHAVAAALLGDIEPAGRLVTTFPTEDGATPAWSVTPVDGDLRYREGPFLGYRGHAAGHAPPPAFWFGHGLGYTTWAYSAAVVEHGGQSPAVSVTVTNTGSRRGREVVQVYFKPDAPEQPVRLVGWASVEAAPGESRRAQVQTDARMWRRWHTQESTWDVPDARGRLIIARGLGDIRATLELPSDLRR